MIKYMTENNKTVAGNTEQVNIINRGKADTEHPPCLKGCRVLDVEARAGWERNVRIGAGSPYFLLSSVTKMSRNGSWRDRISRREICPFRTDFDRACWV